MEQLKLIDFDEVKDIAVGKLVHLAGRNTSRGTTIGSISRVSRTKHHHPTPRGLPPPIGLYCV